MIYQEHPDVGAILHVHGWIEGTVSTDVNYPCGTLQLAASVADLVRRRARSGARGRRPAQPRPHDHRTQPRRDLRPRRRQGRAARAHGVAVPTFVVERASASSRRAERVAAELSPPCGSRGGTARSTAIGFDAFAIPTARDAARLADPPRRARRTRRSRPRESRAARPTPRAETACRRHVRRSSRARRHRRRSTRRASRASRTSRVVGGGAVENVAAHHCAVVDTDDETHERARNGTLIRAAHATVLRRDDGQIRTRRDPCPDLSTLTP